MDNQCFSYYSIVCLENVMHIGNNNSICSIDKLKIPTRVPIFLDSIPEIEIGTAYLQKQDSKIVADMVISIKGQSKKRIEALKPVLSYVQETHKRVGVCSVKLSHISYNKSIHDQIKKGG